MLIEGMIRTSGPAEVVVRGLADDATLKAIAPRGFEFRPVIDGRSDFTVRRGFGPIVLTLQGHMSVTPDDEPQAWWLEVKAAHLIGGSVKVALNVTTTDPTPESGNMGSLSWTGDMTATGLAGRLLNDYQARVNEVLTNLFLILREAVEGPRQPQPEAPAA